MQGLLNPMGISVKAVNQSLESRIINMVEPCDSCHPRASVTRRTFGHSGIAVHTWYACPALIKSIWAMAISQHQFYLDRKQSKSKIHAARSLSEIAIDLTETGTLKTSKLANMGSKGKIISGSSGSLLSSGSQESDSSQSAKKDMLAALKSRQEALEETLRQRLEELKKLCLREAVSSSHTHTHTRIPGTGPSLRMFCGFKPKLGRPGH